MTGNQKLLFTCMLCACLNPLFSQKVATTAKKFTFLAGVNASNMNFNKGVPAPISPIAASWKTGLTIGFSMQVHLVSDLYLQPEYYFTQRKGADKSTSINYSNDYLSLPVLLKYQLSQRFALLAGPQVEVLIHATANGTTITHDVEERSIGAIGGAEVNIYKSLFFSARYLYGFNHIGIGQRSNIKEFKYEGVNLLLGVRF